MDTTYRKLTTILSADVQGYSRLMSADEEGTHSLLKECRDAMARLIESHGGRVVNTWGDGLLADFPSVVEAVRAAVDVQNELAGRNDARAGDARMLFRIGINLGDVIVDGEDIYGDGVNIAARLQTSAEPGGILVSRTVYDQVRNKVPVGFQFLGELEVKNLDEAIPSYAIRIGEGRSEPEPSATPPLSPSGARPQERVARNRSQPGGMTLIPMPPTPQSAAIFGVAAVAVVAVNALTWGGTFWAKWPLLGLAAAAAIGYSRTLPRRLRMPAVFAVVGLLLIGINLFTWSGTFWAKWPILGLAIAALLRSVAFRGTAGKRAE